MAFIPLEPSLSRVVIGDRIGKTVGDFFIQNLEILFAKTGKVRGSETGNDDTPRLLRVYSVTV
jgi:hypothetical protein